MNKSNIITIGFVFILLIAINLFNISYPVQITNTSKSSELSVVGEGKVDVIPDTAYIDLGISVNNIATVEEAQKNMDKTNNAIIEAMKKLGIEKADIKTSNYSIYPNETYDGSTSRVTGYNGNVAVTIKVKGTDKASQVIQVATKAGANQVQGTRFLVEKPEKYREAARTKAIANAKEQAQKLAKDLGIPLGKVVNMVEYSPNSSTPMYDMARSGIGSMGGGGSPQLEAGSQTITSVVTLYFEKK